MTAALERRTEAEAFPRVLLVNGEPFSRATGTGMTLCSLFAGWPKDRLGCLYVSDVEPEAGICNHFWKLSLAHVPLARQTYRLIRRPLPSATVAGGPVRGSDVQPVANTVRGSDVAESRIQRWLRAIARRQNLLHLSRYRIPPAVLDEVSGFRPDLIYSMLGPNYVLRLVLDVHGRCAVPVVPHFMDDWVTALYRRSIFRPVLRGMQRLYVRRILKLSPVRLTIGHDMAEEFRRRFGGEFHPFMNAVERTVFASAERGARPPGPIRLVYVGGLHLNRWIALLEIGEALRTLRGEGVRAELRVHTHQRFKGEAQRLVSSGLVSLGETLSPAEVPRVLRGADILVHVESFDKTSREYARYSVSTKIPECMASGRPIFAYGPSELASIRHVTVNGAGICVGRRDAGALLSGVRSLVQSEALRTELGAKGLEVATRFHDAERQRERFRATLRAVARGGAQ